VQGFEQGFERAGLQRKRRVIRFMRLERAQSLLLEDAFALIAEPSCRRLPG